MTISDVIMIPAVLAAPILAVQVQKVIESYQRHQQRRQEIFEILMSTRAHGMRTSHEHVRALNMIDIDYSEKRFFWGWKVLPEQKTVIHAWKLYKDHLNSTTTRPPNEIWHKDADKLFLDVLYKMSESLGYDFDKVMLEKDVYRPQAHLNWDVAQQSAQELMLEILGGRRSVPIHIVETPAAQAAQDAQRTLRSTQVGTASDGMSSLSRLPAT